MTELTAVPAAWPGRTAPALRLMLATLSPPRLARPRHCTRTQAGVWHLSRRHTPKLYWKLIFCGMRGTHINGQINRYEENIRIWMVSISLIKFIRLDRFAFEVGIFRSIRLFGFWFINPVDTFIRRIIFTFWYIAINQIDVTGTGIFSHNAIVTIIIHKCIKVK